MSYHIPDWELTYPLYPRSVLPNSIRWVRLDGSSLVPEDGQPLPYNLHFSWDSLDRAIDGEAQVDVHSLVFPDPSSFIAANHYMKVAQVLRPGGPSELLSRSNVDTDLRTESYIELNRLSRFTKAFPGGSNS